MTPIPRQHLTDPIEILRAAKAILSDPERVVKKGTHIREDGNGNWTSFYAPVCRVCMVGALGVVSSSRPSLGNDKAFFRLRDAANESGIDITSMTRISDGTRMTQHDIAAVFDRAIELAQKDVPNA